MFQSTAAKKAFGAVAVAFAAIALVASCTLPAQAAPASTDTASIAISRASAQSQPSGSTWIYNIQVSCSSVASASCTSPVISIPTTNVDHGVSDIANWISLDSSSANAGVTLDTQTAGTAKLTLPDIAAGTVKTFVVDVKAPNVTTPDGTTWTLTPTISGADFDPATVSTPATGTATATGNVGLSKGIVSSDYDSGKLAYHGGAQAFSYDVAVRCASYSSTTGLLGVLGYQSITVTDPLPSNFVYVSSSTAQAGDTVTYDAASNTVTFTDPTGKECNDTAAQGGAIGFRVNGTTLATASMGDVINNTASVTATYIGSSTPATATASANVVLIKPPAAAPGSFTKRAFGRIGTVSTDDPYNAYSGAYGYVGYTYPGDWTGDGQAVDFEMQYQNQGQQFTSQDPVPCLDNASGQVYSSNDVGTTCKNPAFVTSTVKVSGFIPTSSWAPVGVFTDGTSQPLTLVSSTTNNSGTPVSTYAIPAGKTIAEVDFPTDPGQETASATQYSTSSDGASAGQVNWINPSTSTKFAIGYELIGYTPTSVAALSTLQNTSTTKYPDNANSTTNSAYAVVLQPKNVFGASLLTTTDQNGHTIPSGANFYMNVPALPTQPVVLTYLMPVGVSPTSTPGLSPTFVKSGNSTTATPTLTTVPNFAGAGRTLYRWTYPASAFTAIGDYGWSMSYNAKALQPAATGTYLADATAGYEGQVDACTTDLATYYLNLSRAHTLTSSPYPPQNTGPQDFNGDGSTGYCGASGVYTIAGSGPAGFSLTKLVQGDKDNTPLTSPNVGSVSPNGSATYTLNWVDSGGTSLQDPVIYDVLPYVGDTGTLDTTASTQRGSEFAVTLTSVSQPTLSNVTVYYSLSTNPCRPEVAPNDTNCTDDWTTTAPSDLSTVKALKFAYSGTAASGTSFSASYSVAIPNIAAGKIAWNTAATGAIDADSGSQMLPAEPPKVGIEYIPSFAITGQMWFDANHDGIREPGETTAEQGQVTTTLPDGTTRTVQTDADGHYVLDNLPAGTYTLKFQTWMGDSVTLQNQGTDPTVDSDIDPKTSTTTVTVGMTGADTQQRASTSSDGVDAQFVVPHVDGGFYIPTPGISIQKLVQDDSGQWVTSASFPSNTTTSWQVTVTNSGTETLTGVALKDDLAPGCDTTVDTLAPGASTVTTCTTDGLESGSQTNTATVTATAEDGTALSGDSAATATYTPVFIPAPGISITKTVRDDSGNQVKSATLATGEAPHWTVTVTNTGNEDLTDVNLTDSIAPGCDTTIATLAAGGSTTLECDSPTSVDPVTNTATVVGTAADGSTVTANDDATASFLPAPAGTPSIAVTKQVQDSNGNWVADATLAADAKPNWQIVVTNNGDTALTDVKLADPIADGCSSTVGDLAAGESKTVTCDSGTSIDPVTNTVTATGTGPDGTTVTATADATAEFVKALPASHPAIKVTKQVQTDKGDWTDSTTLKAGERPHWEVTVTNTGDVDLQDVTLDDPIATGCTTAVGDLAIGQSVTIECSSLTSQFPVTNTVTATGQDKAGDQVSDSADAHAQFQIAVPPVITPPAVSPAPPAVVSPHTNTPTGDQPWLVRTGGAAAANIVPIGIGSALLLLGAVLLILVPRRRQRRE